MPTKNLSIAAARFVQQLKIKIQRLTDEVTTLDVSTYAVGESQFVAVVDAADEGTVAALDARLSEADSAHVNRRGFTQVAFDCDLTTCTQTGRTDDVEPVVGTMHRSAVDGALAGREAMLDVGYEVLRAYG